MIGLFGDHTRCAKFVDFPFVQGADGVKVLKPTPLIDSSYGFLLQKSPARFREQERRLAAV